MDVRGAIQHIQLVEFDTSRPISEVRDALDGWLQSSMGRRTLQMAIAASDRDRPNHYWELLEFPTEEAAAKSMELPETKAAFEKWSSMLDGEPIFHNLEVFEQLGGPAAPPVEHPLGPTPGGG